MFIERTDRKRFNKGLFFTAFHNIVSHFTNNKKRFIVQSIKYLPKGNSLDYSDPNSAEPKECVD